MFAMLAEMEDRISDLRGLKSGHLRLAVTTAAKYFAPRLLGAYSRAHPGIDISLQIHNRQTLMDRLTANADDVYVFAQPPASADVVTEPLIANPLVVYAPAGHPLATAGRIPFARIAEEPFLMREPGSGTHMAVQALFEAHGLEPRVRMELSTNEAIKQGILAGLGLSILPKHTFGIGTDPAGFSVLDVEGLPLNEQWHIVYAKGKHLGGIPRSFIDFAHAEATALAAG
jgi:DNA-binding transcriptional LysR family regulator